MYLYENTINLPALSNVHWRVDSWLYVPGSNYCKVNMGVTGVEAYLYNANAPKNKTCNQHPPHNTFSLYFIYKKCGKPLLTLL